MSILEYINHSKFEERKKKGKLEYLTKVYLVSCCKRKKKKKLEVIGKLLEEKVEGI